MYIQEFSRFSSMYIDVSSLVYINVTISFRTTLETNENVLFVWYKNQGYVPDF